LEVFTEKVIHVVNVAADDAIIIVFGN